MSGDDENIDSIAKRYAVWLEQNRDKPLIVSDLEEILKLHLSVVDALLQNAATVNSISRTFNQNRIPMNQQFFDNFDRMTDSVNQALQMSNKFIVNIMSKDR